MTKIAERYLLKQELGAGGMGTVYLGEDTITHREIAIKQLHHDGTDIDSIERFKREGEVLRELNHPNIVKMLDAVEEDGKHYLIMEYVTGGDLAHRLQAGQIPLEEVINIAIDLADALTRAHRLNIVHRDLKPANILFDDDGVMRLTDFGVAYLAHKERLTDTNTIVGTLDYLPPEAFEGTNLDTRGDIWAFGVVLFEMLTGKRPFQGETISHVLHNIIGGNLPDLEKLRPDAPIALIDLVYRMLERDIQARIPSVRIIGAELEAVLQQRETDIPYQQLEMPTTDNIHLPSHNLPYEETVFVGRDTEITEISKLLQQQNNRLITILGQGGMGKTRLSIKVAHNQLAHFEDGVYLIELAPLNDANRVIPAIADAIGYQFQSNDLEHAQQLFNFLQSRHILLVMDNYEHIMEASTIVSDILKYTANVSVIVTSRKPLAIQGEIIYALDGMDFPTSTDLKTALGYSAVKLLVNRGKLARPDFEINEDNVTAITDICRMVHGMPLGIVLAASWLSMLTLEEIVSELKAGIDILEDEVGNLPDRQHSIRAVMNYSWQQMSANERDVFMKLSVFRDGFTRVAAENIADAKLRVLMALYNKTLLRRENRTGRYIIHELLRQYAEEHLIESGMEEDAKIAHAEYFSTLMKTQDPMLKGKGQLQAILLIESEMSNLTTAWKYATNTHRTAILENMLEAFYLYGTFRTWNTQTYEAFEYTRQSWDVYHNPNAPLHTRLMIHFPAKNRDRMSDLQTALAVAEQQHNQFEIAYCKQQLGIILSHQQGDLGGENTQRGIRYFEEAIQIFRELEEPFYMAMAMDDMAWALATSSRLDDRVTLLNEIVAIRRQIGDQVGLARGASGVASSQYQLTQSIAILEEGFKISRELQDHDGTAWQSAMLTLHNFYYGNLDVAKEHGLRALQLAETYNIAQVGLFARMPLLSIDLLKGQDPQEIEAELTTLFPDGLDGLKGQVSIYFSAHHTYLLLYTLLSKSEHILSILKQLLTGFGTKYVLWALPNVALYLADSQPETALVYFEYAIKNQDHGSRWMLYSDRHMTVYRTLREQYPEESTPQITKRLETLDTPTLISEIISNT